MLKGGIMGSARVPSPGALAALVSVAAHAAVVVAAALAPLGQSGGPSREATAAEAPQWTAVRLVFIPPPRRAARMQQDRPAELTPPASVFAPSRPDAGLEAATDVANAPPLREAEAAARSLVAWSTAVGRSAAPEMDATPEPDERGSTAFETPVPPEAPPRRIVAPRREHPAAKRRPAVADVRAGEETAVRIVHLPSPEYPRRSRRRGQEGTVVLEVEVLADGGVGAVRVLRGSRHEWLASAAKAAVRNARFRPATSAGRPVRSTVEIPFRFELR
jgi:protein TonB